MAIEAACQVAHASHAIKGYKLANVKFYKPLLVSLTAEGVETQFHLRPKKSNNNTSEWNDFSIYMCSSEEWTQVCQGSVMTKYWEADIQEHNRSSRRLWSISECGIKNCKRTVEPKELYENLEAFGYGFGPTFQRLQKISFNNDFEATATINPHERVSKSSNDPVQAHVIHPTVLDAVFHLTLVALSKGGWEPVPTILPTHLESMWISNRLLARNKDQQLKVYTKPTFQGYRDFDSLVYAFDSIDKEYQISLEGYRGTAVSILGPASLKNSRWKQLCYQIDWKPDWEMLIDTQVSSYCDATVSPSEIPSPELVDESEMICLYFVSEVLSRFRLEGFESSSAHFTRYLEWGQRKMDQCDAESLPSTRTDGKSLLTDEVYSERRLTQLEESSPEGKLYVTVGRNLTQILRGEVDTLSLLFNEPLAQEFYSSATVTSFYKKIAAYVDLLAHKNPNLKILEIGAGTGGTTRSILQKLAEHGHNENGVPRCGRYDYTDISPAFFNNAKKTFSKYADRMTYQTLNIEQDPIAQGFEAEGYDVVLAANVCDPLSRLRHAC